MKKLALIPVLVWLLFALLYSQSNFDANAYYQFLAENQDLTYQDLQQRFPLSGTYYKFTTNQTDLEQYQFFDSVKTKFNLTNDELTLLNQNHFMVTERLSYPNFGKAFHEIYIRDLPVFITTDAILHALHVSYDMLLSDVELAIMKPNLIQILDGLYSNFSLLVGKYGSNADLQKPLQDVDLYVTIARSLIENSELAAHLIDQSKVDSVWQAILNKQAVQIKLFADRERWIDFSQFTVRGHYTRAGLPEYFKTMMWLGRIGFLLTQPSDFSFSEADIKRMNLGAFMLDELLDLSDVRELLEQNDRIINFLVGQSDNLTPAEYKAIKTDLGLTDAGQLLNQQTYDQYILELKTNNSAQQKILSQILMANPFSAQPDTLPVVFLLSGQRFIIDSYILFNVVFDRIIFEGQKIWRPLPDPLDAMFVLGNVDALYLLKDELEQYKYASQLNALRYLIDSYDEAFWQESLYNVWLNSIRALNPQKDTQVIADFLSSAAWHQCKLNTQLASWAQLRHDNLLYAKQSYTGGSTCSFPYSFVEPNPEFFARIAQFAGIAKDFFDQFSEDGSDEIYRIHSYFNRLLETMNKLENLAQKELNNTPFNEEDISWLKKMLFQSGMSGRPPYDGWYADLFYFPDDIIKDDFVIADVHTQPTDFSGNMVGHVLHVGTGKINLGVFLANAPYEGHPHVVFVGPLMSYYEKVTSNFKRLTDEEWTMAIEKSDLPQRPDWVNLYLADSLGQKRAAGRELPAQLTNIDPKKQNIAQSFELYQNFPNPFNPTTTIRYRLRRPAHVRLTVYNLSGEKIFTLIDEEQPAGLHSVKFNGSKLPSGLYFASLKSAGQQQTIKMVLMK